MNEGTGHGNKLRLSRRSGRSKGAVAWIPEQILSLASAIVSPLRVVISSRASHRVSPLPPPYQHMAGDCGIASTVPG